MSFYRDAKIAKSVLCFVDLETTGLGTVDSATYRKDHPCRYHRILEVGAVKMNVASGRIDEYRTYVDPGRPIPSDATWIHGITDDDVQGAPTALNAIQGFRVFSMDAHMILGFNSPFDLRFLVHEYVLASEEPPNIAFYDVGRLAARLGYGRLSLDELCLQLGIERPGAEAAVAVKSSSSGASFSINLTEIMEAARRAPVSTVSRDEQPHRAVPDARATAECFIKLMTTHYGDDALLSEVAAKHDEATPVYSVAKALRTISEKEAGYKPRICVTGKIEGLMRKEIVQQLGEVGYTYVPRVNNSIEFLVVGKRAGPSKLMDAEALGVEIVSADDFVKWLAALREVGPHSKVVPDGSAEQQVKKAPKRDMERRSPEPPPPPLPPVVGSTSGSVLDHHFALQDQIQGNYRKRKQGSEFLLAAVAACEQQIELARDAAAAFRRDGFSDLPAHIGYKQLAVIREKQHRFEDAIKLATIATVQGWAGDWDHRIARCKKRLAKKK